MSSNSFVFKQFEIKQDKCAMKVGTDAVLLGAWADATQAKRVLDIGTGTGILALMIAQKSEAQICAIDIDIDSYQQAIENIHYTLWKDRIQIFHSSIQEFSKTINEQFDLIITNPPYFTDAYKAKEISRNNARHTDELPFEILIECVCKLLQPQGVFYIILPFAEAQIFKNMAKQNNLCLVQSMRIKTKADKEPKRLLMKYSFEQKIQEETEIVIENDDRHHYTKEYIELTKDYYLDIDKQK
jgi:tRNA1Val (adenine37-N6)-methyltransferase